MSEVILGAVIMLVGVFVGFVITAVKDATPEKSIKGSETLSMQTMAGSSYGDGHIQLVSAQALEDLPSPSDVKEQLNTLLAKLRAKETFGNGEESKDELLDSIDEELDALAKKL